MEVLRCPCSMLGCNPPLLDSVSHMDCRCQDPSRRSVSSGAVLSLSAVVAIEVRGAAVHSADAPLVDLCAANRGQLGRPPLGPSANRGGIRGTPMATEMLRPPAGIWELPST
jgi:hypothetical protein